ncbi:hypothetical protein Q671_08580 [Halomonas sp. PBN3]|nr:hypothetical protein Q671_08580 [Halomonas sp. PBN3]
MLFLHILWIMFFFRANQIRLKMIFLRLIYLCCLHVLKGLALLCWRR